MFTILKNTGFRENFKNLFLGFRRVWPAINEQGSRINNTNCRYSFHHSQKTFNFVRSNNFEGKNEYNNSCENSVSIKDQKTWNISGWAAVLGVIFTYLWVNKSAQAEENTEDKPLQGLENEQARCVTKDNFKEISLHLTRDDPTFRSLEMGYALTEMELKAIYDSIKENTELGYITWHKDQIKDQIRYSILVNIENRLIENNKNYRYYPNDFTHALLSKHAYVTSTKGSSISLDPKVDMHLKNWKVVEVFDDTQKSGYYGAIYINDKTHQVVLANRGTEEIIKGLFNRNGDWKTNFEEILGGQIIVGQQAKNLRATAAAIEIAKEKGYRLSFTGHSLGGWLAELSAYYSFAYFDYRNVKAVTFESPGTAPMMEQLQSNIRSKDARVKLETMDIVTYLANPNPANSCNPHVGRVYRVQPKMKLTEKVVESYLPKKVREKIGNKIKAFFSVEGHLMAGILETFDPETGKPRECQKMLDWPRVEYLGNESFSSGGKKIAKEGIGKSSLSSVTQAGLNMAMDHLIGDRTLMTIVGFLKAYIKGGIDADQYWAYFEHIDLENEERTELSFDNRFALYTLGKYREGNDTHRLKLSTGSVDKYLYKLYSFKDKLRDNEDLPLIIKNQLEELLKSFKIVGNGEDYILIPNLGYNVEGIKEKTQRLLDVIPNDIRTVWKNAVTNKTIIYLNGGIAEEVKKLHDNLPPLTTYYVSIRNKEKELSEKLDKEEVVVIAGLGGMGKSTLATKQGENCKKEEWRVMWLKGMQIDEEFFRLARELKIKTINLTPSEVRDLVYKKLEEMSKEKPVLLIFDNVEDGKKMSDYLVNRPARTKVIITTRDRSLLKTVKSIQMEGFDREQAITYVKDALGKNKAEAEKLVAVVGLSPFRLSKAVGYLWNNDLMSINEYIKYYEAIKKGHNQNETIYPEVEMLFGDLKTNSPVSWQLLQYMAYLDAEGISVDFIISLMGLTREELQTHVNELKRMSLMNVEGPEDEKKLRITHRIVQEETKQALMAGDVRKAKVVLEKLLTELNSFIEAEGTEWGAWGMELDLIVHAKTLINEAKTMDLISKERAALIANLGLYHHKTFDDEQALHYWTELLNNQKLINAVDSTNLLKARLLKNITKIYINLEGEENIQKGLRSGQDCLQILQRDFPKNHKEIALVFLSMGNAYYQLEDNQMSIKNFQEALKNFRALPFIDSKHMEKTLNGLGLATHEEGERLKYLEGALSWHYKRALESNLHTAGLISSIAFTYRILGDEDKYLEYQKQAYSIVLTTEYKGKAYEKGEIEGLQPNFFTRKGSAEGLNCLGGYKVGNECRYIITSRGETDENLITVKQKIQEIVLQPILAYADMEYDSKWNTVRWIGTAWGVDFLKRTLKELGDNDKNIELAQMLCFERMNLAIMKPEKKAYDVVKSFTLQNPKLVKKIAIEHPEFFVDGSIVEACIQAMPEDKSFKEHILKHVKYMGMEERNGSKF